jgi:outer membrane biosynthesis protein TonB
MRDNARDQRPSGMPFASNRRFRSRILDRAGRSPTAMAILATVLLSLALLILARLVQLSGNEASAPPPVLPAPTTTAGPTPQGPVVETPPPTPPALVVPLLPAPPPATTPRPDVGRRIRTPEPVAPAPSPRQRPAREPVRPQVVPDQEDQAQARDENQAAEESDDADQDGPKPERVQQRQQGSSDEETARAIARSLCARWGIPQDRCDQQIRRQQQTRR